MSLPLTASTTGSAAANRATRRIARKMRCFILELHRRARSTGESGDVLVARRVADADAEAHTGTDLPRDVVIEPYAGVRLGGRQIRDLDGGGHRPGRHRAPPETEERVRADIGK